MKTKISFWMLIIAAAFSITNLYSQSVRTVRTYYDIYNQHIKAIEQVTDDLKLHGIQKYYYENGDQQAIYNYKFNKKEGAQKTFFHNGQVQSLKTYQDDQLHGPKQEYKYLDAKYLLYEDYYYENGIPIRGKEYYDNGAKFRSYEHNGLSYEWTDKGAKVYELNRVNGLLQGEQKYWYPDGKLFATTKYKDDKEDGEWKYFDKAGQIIGTEFYSLGKPTGQWKVYLDEKLKPVMDYSNTKYKRIIYHNDSVSLPEGTFWAADFLHTGEKFWDGFVISKSGETIPIIKKVLLRDGQGKFYNKNGTLHSEGKLWASTDNESLKIGVWNYYKGNGELDYVEEYFQSSRNSTGLLKKMTAEDINRERNALKQYKDSADFYFKQQDYDRAIYAYQELLKLTPKDEYSQNKIEECNNLVRGLQNQLNRNLDAISGKARDIENLYTVQDELASRLENKTVYKIKKRKLYDAYKVLQEHLIAEINNSQFTKDKISASNTLIKLYEKMNAWANGETKNLEKNLKNTSSPNEIRKAMEL